MQKHPVFKVSALFNDAASLEKLLKLSQALCQITAGLHYDSQTIKRFDSARASIALTRRYFRLFKWIDCWTLVGREYEVYSVYAGGKGTFLGEGGRASYSRSSTGKKETTTQSEAGPEKSTFPETNASTNAYWGRDDAHLVLIMLKWSLLGMYFFLEMFNITDAIELTSNPWSRLNGLNLQREAYKMWVYGLAASLVLGLYELAFVIQGQEEAMIPSSASDTKISQAGSGLSANRRAEVTGPRSTSEEVSPRTEIPTPPASQPEDFVPPSDPSEKPEDAHALSTATVTKPLLDRNSILKQLAVDGCDILIPAAAVGWIPLASVSVGVAGGVSAALSLRGTWRGKRESGLGRGRGRG